MSMVLYGLMLNEHFVEFKCQWLIRKRFYEFLLNGRIRVSRSILGDHILDIQILVLKHSKSQNIANQNFKRNSFRQCNFFIVVKLYFLLYRLLDNTSIKLNSWIYDVRFPMVNLHILAHMCLLPRNCIHAHIKMHDKQQEFHIRAYSMK